MPSNTGSSYRVEHKAVDSLTGGEDHHGGAAVQSITSCHELSSRLQSIILTWLIICGLWNNMWKIVTTDKDIVCTNKICAIQLVNIIFFDKDTGQDNAVQF